MIVGVTVEGVEHRIDFDDMTVHDWAVFSKRFGIGWLEFNPLRHAEHAEALIALCVDRFQIDPSELGTAKAFLENVTYIAADDRPTEYTNGVPPVADENGTEPSSLSSADTDGPPT